MPRDIAIFFGSGVSIPTGLPNVGELTRRILEDSYFRHTDDNYYPGENPSPQLQQFDRTHLLQRFLGRMHSYQAQFLREFASAGVMSNYEHLYHLCDQIQRCIHGIESNSALWEFIKYIEDRTLDLIEQSSSYSGSYELSDFVSRAKMLIESVVENSLKVSKDKTVVGFSLLEALIRDDDIGRVDIITLNHDILVERVLESNSLDYADGFGEHDGEVRWYEPSTLRSIENQVALVKLHGSINWHLLQRPDGRRQYAIPQINDVEHCHDGQDNLLTKLGGRAIFLSGGRKELTYNYGLFADMYDALTGAMRNTKTILMSGFGWSDVGVSYRLRTWLDRDPNRKIILLHENPEDIRLDSNGLPSSEFDRFQERNQLILIKKWFCDTQMNDLCEHLI